MNRPSPFDVRSADIIDPLPIQEVSEFLLLDLSRRIEKSLTLEQLISRESELDEVWRLLDFAVIEAHRVGSAEAEICRLQALRDGIMEIHDLVGVESDRVKAAARLRSLAGKSFVV